MDHQHRKHRRQIASEHLAWHAIALSVIGLLLLVLLVAVRSLDDVERGGAAASEARAEAPLRPLPPIVSASAAQAVRSGQLRRRSSGPEGRSD